MTREDVAKAIETLKAKGEFPSHNKIRKLLGDKGSYKTISDYREEILGAGIRKKAKDSPESLEAFRRIWARALEEGKALADALINDLQEAQAGLLADIDRLAAENERCQEHLQAEASQRRTLLNDLATANNRQAAERVSSENAATKLAAALERITEIQERHAAELAGERTAHKASMSNMEDRLQSAFREKASLETAKADLINQLRQKESELAAGRTALEWQTKRQQELETTLAKVREQRDEAARKLSEEITHREDLLTSHASEMANLNSQLRVSEKQAITLEGKLAAMSSEQG